MQTKWCSKCGQEFPATTEYFSQDKYQKSGLTGHCKACRRANTQKWRDENPDKALQYGKDYYWSHRDHLLEQNRDWHKKNPEKRKKSHDAWYEGNKEYARTRRRNYYVNNKEQSREYDRQRYEKKGDQIREYSRQYKLANPDKITLQEQKRTAREMGLPDTLTTSQWKYAIAYWGGICVYCSQPFDRELQKLSLDHFIPISHPACPGTVATNCLPACLRCNTSKGAKEALGWMIERFGQEKAKDTFSRILAYFESLDIDSRE